MSRVRGGKKAKAAKSVKGYPPNSSTHPGKQSTAKLSAPRVTHVISVRDLSFAYSAGGPGVLHDISLDIGAGKVCALLGPNGSGKTTLLNLILGWLKPQKGRIELDGKNGVDLTRREMSRIIGLVPQEEPTGFELSVFEYVLLGRAPYLGFLETPGPDDRRLAEAAINIAGIKKLRARPLTQLSAGEKQLAAIARVLAQDPAIFLLDEPMSHLDLANTQRVCMMLDSLRNKGKTVVFTTHDPNIASVSADQIVMLVKGKIAASGAVKKTLTARNVKTVYGVDAEILVGNDRPIILTRLQKH
jgi:iron complex transport system ATP-binding protein